jgi:hypothetical protein
VGTGRHRDRPGVARVAAGLGVASNTAKDAVLADGKRVLIDKKDRFNGVNVVGVDDISARRVDVLDSARSP